MFFLKTAEVSVFKLKKHVEIGTYVTNFSEHDANEESYKRLFHVASLYGNSTAMALELKRDLFTRLPNVQSNFPLRNDGTIF